MRAAGVQQINQLLVIIWDNPMNWHCSQNIERCLGGTGRLVVRIPVSLSQIRRRRPQPTVITSCIPVQPCMRQRGAAPHIAQEHIN